MTTVLDKELKREVTVRGVPYTVALGPDGIRLTGKGRRKPDVELRWDDLLSGEAAMAVALNASLSKQPPIARSETKRPPATAVVPLDEPPEAKPRTKARGKGMADGEAGEKAEKKSHERAHKQAHGSAHEPADEPVKQKAAASEPAPKKRLRSFRMGGGAA